MFDLASFLPRAVMQGIICDKLKKKWRQAQLGD